MIPPLTETEKAYFDTIKSVARSARPGDLRLWRMTADGVPCAVIVQRVISADDATEAGFQPLAVLVDDVLLGMLRTVEGAAPEAIDPGSVEGAAE